MTPTARRERVRALLAGGHCVHPAPVFDAISARIANDLGFEMAVIGGSVAALAILSAPDRDLLALSELADHVRRICRADCPPLLVDAGHGFGNALNVMRTVQELEAAGAAALMIEDLAPGTNSAPALAPLSECAAKMRAAITARSDPALVLVGRTGALPLQGLDATLARVRSYAEAGADAICVVGVKAADEIKAVADAVSLPIVVGMVPAAIRDRTSLARHGVRVSLLGHQPLSAAVQATYDVLKSIREPSNLQPEPRLASAQLIGRLTRADDYDAWGERFRST